MRRLYCPYSATRISGFGDGGGYPEPPPMPGSSPGAGMMWKWNEGSQVWDTVPSTISYQAPISLDPGYAAPYVVESAPESISLDPGYAAPYVVESDSKKAYIFAGALVAAAIAYLALVK